MHTRRHRFDVEVDIAPEQLPTLFALHPRIEWQEGTWISPMLAADRFVCGRAESTKGFFLTSGRNRSGISPPIVLIEAEPAPMGARVSFRFLREQVGELEKFRRSTVLLVMLAIGLVAAAWLVLAGAGPEPLSTNRMLVVPLAALGVPGIIGFCIWAYLPNRANQRRLAEYWSEHMRLLGEVLAPHLVGNPDDDPFRG